MLYRPTAFILARSAAFGCSVIAAVNGAVKCRKSREKAVFRPFDRFYAIW